MPTQIIALGLLSGEDLALLGSKFDGAYAIDETPCFGELLWAIDDADRELWRQRDQVEPSI